jgi:hypothetical protein
MKVFFFALMFIGFSAPSYANCVVEIMDGYGDPLGYIFQEKDCRTAQSKCRVQLARINQPGARCEITLDIPTFN